MIKFRNMKRKLVDKKCCKCGVYLYMADPSSYEARVVCYCAFCWNKLKDAAYKYKCEAEFSSRKLGDAIFESQMNNISKISYEETVKKRDEEISGLKKEIDALKKKLDENINIIKFIDECTEHSGKYIVSTINYGLCDGSIIDGELHHGLYNATSADEALGRHMMLQGTDSVITSFNVTGPIKKES